MALFAISQPVVSHCIGWGLLSISYHPLGKEGGARTYLSFVGLLVLLRRYTLASLLSF